MRTDKAKNIAKVEFDFDVEKLNEILSRRKGDYDDETRYLINCLGYKASEINRMNINMIKGNYEIIMRCQNIINNRLEDKKLKNEDILKIKENAESNLSELGIDGEQRRISNGMRFNILNRDNFTCAYCGRSAPDVILHIDHKLPYSKGGKSTKNNLITSCMDCNLGKNNKYDTTKK